MDNRLVESAKQLNKRRRRRQAWTRSLVALGCVVMLSTVYIMSLPAITKEQDTFCGAEAHEHTDACYQEREGEAARVLICAPEHHVHGQSCFDAQGLPVCGQADYVAHSHDALCYDENGGLICALPERSVHVHTEDCYETVAGHTHGEACYEEAGGHTHSDGCYETVGGHTHGEACYETVGGHTHGDGCYETVAGHTHTESCYEGTGGHIHGEACYETVAGHTHSEACLAEDGQLICTLTEGEDRRELRCTEPETAGQQSLICTLEETEDETLLICPEPEAEGEKVLICTEPEAEGEKVLTCTEPEAEGERLLICTEPETEEKTLICREAQAAVHQHTQDCFGPEKEKVLTCTKEEHSHILQCYSDRKADVETPEQWEETFRDVELTGLHRDDLLAIARTQLGYRESVRNYTVKEDGETKDGYTRYGDWYGYPYSEWCAMFVSFCLEYAEVPDMPHHAACQAWIDILVEEELYLPVEEYTPWPGDIIFFDGNGDDYSDHVGIVEEITEEGMIKTIEGNSGRRVCQNEYEPDDPRLLGYGLVPEGELIPKETESAEPTDMPETAETAEPTEIPAETDDAVTEATKPETTEPETTEESTQPENTEIKQTRKVSVYRNHRRDELLPEADEIHVTGNYPEDAVVYAVPAEVEADGEILSAYQISILLPDYSVYQPTQEESLLLTVKNESFEGRTLEVRACPAEGASYELSASARGKMVAFHLPESAPFAVVAVPEALTEQTLQAVIYRDATLQQQSADETVILITGLLPQGAGARAYPVVLDENLIEGEKVLLAYDITIVDREGNPITQEEGQEPFTVSIRPPEWEPSEDENYKIYYVPEEGAPEIMDSENREDAVSFTTDHFSTYVLTAAGTGDPEDPDGTETVRAGFRVVKNWQGDTESDRPGSLLVQLYQDGTAYGDPVELNEANGWQYIWTELPEGFAYTAGEVEVPDGYYITGAGELLDEDTWQITNFKCPVTSLSVEKRWEGGEPLDSATVYLLSNGVQIDEVTLNADNGWFYRWDNLPACGKLGDPITYTLREAEIAGFASAIEEAEAPGEDGWGEAHYIVTNTKLPDAITFRFAKYAVGSSKNPTLLAGAGLELYMVSGDGDTVIPGTELTGKLIRCWTSEDGTAASGGIQTEDLYSGTYYLLETQTPSGHIGLSGPVIFEILAEAGQVNLLQCPYELTLSGGPEIDFPIYNAVAYELPETGGIGTTPYTVGGLLLMIVALALLMYSHKRRKGEQPSF